MGITADDIFIGLRELGLRAGDSVLAHSSLSSFGRVEGGADAVIDGIIRAVSPDGNVLFPTLTGSEALSPENPPTFDVLNTPCWTGIIPETARKRPGFVRSAQPTHSVCAFGPKAEWFIEGHEFSPTPCGIGSPYDRLVQAGGYILLIGVTHSSNTTMHYIEEIAESPWHIQPEIALSTIRYANGRMSQAPVRLHRYGTLRNFARLEPEFLAKGIQVNGKIGESTVRLIKAREMVEIALKRLRENRAALLQVAQSEIEEQ